VFSRVLVGYARYAHPQAFWVINCPTSLLSILPRFVMQSQLAIALLSSHVHVCSAAMACCQMLNGYGSALKSMSQKGLFQIWQAALEITLPWVLSNFAPSRKTISPHPLSGQRHLAHVAQHGSHHASLVAQTIKASYEAWSRDTSLGL
jgi:hypothetical protein